MRAAEVAAPGVASDSNGLWVPPPMAIAHQLVKAWSIDMADLEELRIA